VVPISTSRTSTAPAAGPGEPEQQAWREKILAALGNDDALLALALPAHVLKIVFACFLLLVSVRLVRDSLVAE